MVAGVKTIRPFLIVAVAAVAGLLLLAQPAGAVDNPDYASEPPALCDPAASGAASNGCESSTGTPAGASSAGVVDPVSDPSTPDVAVEAATSGTSSGLAFTGATTLPLIAVGVGLVFLGGLVVLVRRRTLA